MKRYAAIVLVLLSVLSVSAVYAEAVTIAVSERSVVKGPFITLGEIAVLSGDNKARIAELAALRLGNAPQPGAWTTLTPAVLGMRLRGTGADFTDVTWQAVPASITISAAAQIIHGEALAEAAMAALKAEPIDGEAVIAPTAAPSDISVPPGKVEYEARLPKNRRNDAPLAVQVAVLVDGRQFVVVPVRLDARLYRQAMVATRSIAPGQVITAADVASARVEVGRLAGVITEPNKVVGTVSRRMIAAGTPLTAAMTEKPILVKRGSTVTIVARGKGIEATAVGVAMQDGALYQFIRVQNQTSKRIITAQVIDASAVLIKL